MVIRLNDGSQEYISDRGRFKDLIREKLGDECAQYIQELIDEGDYAAKKIETDIDSYESSLDDYNAMCGDLMDQISVLEGLMSKSRIDRRKVLQAVSTMKNEICNHW